MKKKDIFYIVASIILFLGAGMVVFGHLNSSKSGTREVQVEVVKPINADFNQKALDTIADPDKSKDYTFPINIKEGLNNPKPFGQ